MTLAVNAVLRAWEARQTAPAPPEPDALAPLAARIYRDRFLNAPSRVVVVRSPLEGVLAAGLLARAERSVHVAVAVPPLFGTHGVVQRLFDGPARTVLDAWPLREASRRMTRLQERVIARHAEEPVAAEALAAASRAVGRPAAPPQPDRRAWVEAALALPREDGVQDPFAAAAVELLQSASPRPSPSLGWWIELTRMAGWWWAFEDTLLVSARPCTLALDARHRLHAAGGPALAYPDGWTIHAHHGVAVPAVAVMAPGELDARRILTEGNVELRRALVELYGFERFVRDAGATRIHTDGERALYRIELAGDEPLVLVKVTCPSTARVYFLRVPPATATCAQAVAWTFGLDAGTYAPRAET